MIKSFASAAMLLALSMATAHAEPVDVESAAKIKRSPPTEATETSHPIELTAAQMDQVSAGYLHIRLKRAYITSYSINASGN